MNSLCDIQKVVSIHQAIFHCLINAWADTTCVDHGTTLLLCLGIEEVVALRTKMEGRLWGRNRIFTKSYQASGRSYHSTGAVSASVVSREQPEGILTVVSAE